MVFEWYEKHKGNKRRDYKMAITSWFLKRGVSLITKLSLFIFILGLLLPFPCFSYSLPPDNALRVELKYFDERANVYLWVLTCMYPKHLS